MANGGLITAETPRGFEWLEKRDAFFIDWNISPSETYFVRGTRTGIYKWMTRHAGYTVSANQGDLYMQLRTLAEPLGKQLQKAYGGAAMGGTPIGAITGPVNAAATGATALGAGATATGQGATAAAVLGSELVQMAFDELADRVKGPGVVAQALDKIGARDKYHVYFTAVGPKHPERNIQGSTIRLSGSEDHDFEYLARLFMTLKC